MDRPKTKVARLVIVNSRALAALQRQRAFTQMANGRVFHGPRYDLPPTNRANRSLVKFVFGEEDEHEEALYGTANHRVSEGSRG
ncbi:hypothetical protein, partial [Burkholderia pseudomallei]|uniref:hypothetical protein n=1 Tax=Burkholderia pseudomallei TaxID=28450 RepID=UPI001C4C4D13